MTTKNHGRGELSLETVGNAVTCSGRIFRQVNFGGVFRRTVCLEPLVYETNCIDKI